jgi:hypothetical protein
MYLLSLGTTIIASHFVDFLTPYTKQLERLLTTVARLSASAAKNNGKTN